MSVTTSSSAAKLAIHGGAKAVPFEEPDLFKWPIVTSEDEQAVLSVLRDGAMSGIEITRQFETEYAAWMGLKYGLGSCNGTSSLLEAMFGVGLGRGDEIISPSLTYWASTLQAFSLGATPVFADIDAATITLDPKDIEHRITPRTRAIMLVHYAGHPCDMDAILPIARKHRLKVIEDCSHAHGTLYKGKMVGTFGDVAAMSMMTLKGFAIGEAGMLCTNDREIYERAIAFAHYEQHDALTLPELKENAGLPLGALKGRMNQCCSAMGRVQLPHYPRRMRQIQDAINRFWDLLDGVPGIRAHRPSWPDSTMGGWYNPLGHYLPEELGDLPVAKFIDAVSAEGGRCGRTANSPLHLHPVLNKADIYHDGKPTRNAFTTRDVREKKGSLPRSEALNERVFGIPYFKHDRPESIQRYAEAFKKVALNADKL